MVQTFALVAMNMLLMALSQVFGLGGFNPNVFSQFFLFFPVFFINPIC